MYQYVYRTQIKNGRWEEAMELNNQIRDYDKKNYGIEPLFLRSVTGTQGLVVTFKFESMAFFDDEKRASDTTRKELFQKLSSLKVDGTESVDIFEVL